MLSSKLYAQIALAYYPWQSEVSICTSTDRTLFGELRTATNTFWGNITTEPILSVAIKRTEHVSYTAGLSASISPFNAASQLPLVNGYGLHLGSRIMPFEKYKGVQLLFEISPYTNRYFDGGLLRTRLGICYQF